MGKIDITPEQRERYREVDVLALLDALCEAHGLRDHMEARRFIRELHDRQRRAELRAHTGNSRKQAKSGVLQVISPNGTVLPADLRPERGYTAPEQPISPPESPFDPLSLAMRSREKPKRSKNTIPMGMSDSDQRKANNKPKKEKKSRARLSDEERAERAEKRKERKREYARQRYVKKGRPKFRQDGPKPGSQTELIINTLKSNDWDTRKTVNQLVDHPLFAHFKDRGERTHRKNVYASVSVAKGKWQARLQGV